MDALQLFNGALDVLRTDLRDSKRELLARFDSQDEMLGTLDERQRTANGKTAEHVTAIALLRRDIDQLGSVRFHEGRSAKLPTEPPTKPRNAIAAVLISWGEQSWFPYLLWFLIATAGGKAVVEWGKMLIGLFTPKP